MQETISKSKFKAHALEIMRNIEQTGEEAIITSHGEPVLVIKKFTPSKNNVMAKLRGSVIKFDSPTDPVAEDDWELS